MYVYYSDHTTPPPTTKQQTKQPYDIYIHIGDKIKLNNILVQIFCGYQMYDVVLLK